MGRVAEIASGTGFERSANDNAAPCLFLLFERGERPDAQRIREVISHATAWISNEPEDLNTDPDESESWLELLTDGLTFDLLGLAPGPGLQLPEPVHSFDWSVDGADFEAIGLAPGPHIAGAASAAPVVRSMMQLGSRILLPLGGVGVIWQPARSVMGRSYFAQVVDRWLTGGPFPSLGLVAVTEGSDGSLRTEGLHFFAERELVFAPELASDRIATTRLAARLVDELVFTESHSGRHEALAPDGTLVLLESSEISGEILVSKL